jgi:peptidoglycan/LPS O-acetylase OafA/YrhL
MKSKNTSYEEKIDHLRFFAATLVLLFHSVVTWYVWKPLGTDQIRVSPIYNLLLEGHTAVGLFMTLSGFLFATICRDKEINIWSFYRNRVLRIYPLFLTLLLLSCYISPGENNLKSLLTSLFCLQNLGSAVHCDWLTEVLWTVSVEFQFYLIFPFLLVFFRKYSYKYLIGIIVLFSLLRLAAYMATGNIKALSYNTIFGRIDEFIIGMVLGFLFPQIKDKLRHPAWLLFSFVPIYLCASLIHACGGLVNSVKSPIWISWHTLEGMAWGLVIVAYNASIFQFPSRISKALAFAGSVSFSMYVTHYFFLRLSKWLIMPVCFPEQFVSKIFLPLFQQLHTHPFTTSLIFGSCMVFPATFFLSILTYFIIEKPFLEMRTSYTKRLPLPKDAHEERAEHLVLPARV